MKQINAYAFYSLGNLLRDCQENCGLPLFRWWNSLSDTTEHLIVLLDGPSDYVFDESREAAGRLRQLLMGHVDAAIRGDGPDTTLTANEQRDLKAAIWAFGEAFALELGRAPIFYVAPKGIYDTRMLISKAASVYAAYADRLPQEAIDDTNESGRCLAFNLPTAAGFHMARATETVLRKYLVAWNCEVDEKSTRNWGAYVRMLRGARAPEKIVNGLDQLRNLHRNPLLHPEDVLTLPMAMQLQAMCQSLIQVMVADMERKRSDGDPSIAAMLPPPNERTGAA